MKSTRKKGYSSERLVPDRPTADDRRLERDASDAVVSARGKERVEGVALRKNGNRKKEKKEARKQPQQDAASICCNERCVYRNRDKRTFCKKRAMVTTQNQGQG